VKYEVWDHRTTEITDNRFMNIDYRLAPRGAPLPEQSQPRLHGHQNPYQLISRIIIIRREPDKTKGSPDVGRSVPCAVTNPHFNPLFYEFLVSAGITNNKPTNIIVAI
jgi:hypothetical protein